MGVVLSNCPEDYQRQHEASCRAFPHLRCPWWHGLRDGPEAAEAEGHGELLGRGEHEACHGRHEEGDRQVQPRRRSGALSSPYRFVNTTINKGDNYENINDMATMFAKMMHEMKNRNSNSQVNSYSRHGDNKMDKMRMMMKMMKMSNMMNDRSSSSYHSDDNDMYDMFSEMFDSSSDRMDNYRSSDYSNQMGRMSHFKNMFNNMRYKRAAGDNLDLGDRLVEKLAEQKHHMEAK